MPETNISSIFSRLQKVSTKWVLHPFILAASMSLYTLSVLKWERSPQQILPSFFVLEAVALALFLLGLGLFRNFNKAGVTATVILMVSFTYDGIERLVSAPFNATVHHDAPAWLALLITFSIAALLLVAMLKPTRKVGKQTVPTDFAKLNSFWTTMSLILLAVNGIPLLYFEIEENALIPKWITKFHTDLGNPTFATNITTKPDVYYIIVDAFANSATLRQFTNYDNRDFIKYLESRGFYVVPQAASNYDRTHLSLSSSLNMQYINSIPDTLGKSPDPEIVYQELISNSCVVQLFKRLGYKIVWDYYNPCPQADYNICNEFGNDILTGLAMNTPVWGFEQYIPFVRDNYAYKRLATTRQIKSIVNLAGPKFVFIHSTLSHPPTLFDANGLRYPMPRSFQYDPLLIDSLQPYAEQLKFTEKNAKLWIEEILSNSKVKPIIILQADHGPYLEMSDKPAYYNEVMRILNAYCFPGLTKSDLYASITPVNSFRVLFNDYFGAHFPLLPDHSYCSPTRNQPYDWSDVRDKLRFLHQKS